jgi:hypothetical protein
MRTARLREVPLTSFEERGLPKMTVFTVNSPISVARR